MSPGPEHVHTSVRGERAHAAVWGEGERAVIAVHGLASDHRELGALPEALSELGLTVVTPDLRGHGASEGPRGVLSLERALDDLHAWRAWLEARGQRPSVLIGHSLGCFWVLAAGERWRPDAVVAIAPFPSFTGQISRLELAGYKAAGRVHQVASLVGLRTLTVPYKITPDDIIDDVDTIEWARRERVLQRSIPLANVRAFLRLDATVWAARGSCPALFAWPTRDRVIERASSRAVHDAYAGPTEWLELEGPHSCLIGPPGPAAAARIAQWTKGAIG